MGQSALLKILIECILYSVFRSYLKWIFLILISLGWVRLYKEKKHVTKSIQLSARRKTECRFRN